MAEERRAVITGMGVVAPNGIGVEPFWNSLVQGRSAVDRITHFDASSYPCQIAAEVRDFDPLDHMDPKTAKRLDRFAQFAFAASQMAVEDAEIEFDREDPHRVGVLIGSAIGGIQVMEVQHGIFMQKGLKRISPFTVVSSSTHSASGVIACHWRLKGCNTTIAAGCNSGLDALYSAFNAIRLGDADVVVTGAGEAPLTPFSFGAFCASGFLSREHRNPQGALKPYDSKADGLVLGEGGAILIVEELQHALRRDAKIYGEIVSYSALNDAFDLFGVDTNNGTMALNFRQALLKVNMDPKEIDYINAHGNGILSYDINETEAIKEVFGELAYQIPVTSLKPITGHAIATTGVFQVISSLLSMKYGVIPPTINLDDPDPRCDLNYVPYKSQRADLRTVLINAHGFGGRMTILIVRKFPPIQVAS
jgi:3-oxoacyl-[acyl-carrier-protein] synthase II